MIWQDELRRQIEATPEGRWGYDDAVWINYTVSMAERALIEPVAKIIGCVNDRELAGRPRGTILFFGYEPNDGRIASLFFSVRRSLNWNVFNVVREGFFVLEELVDSKGIPPHPYFNFDLISCEETWRDRLPLA